MDGMSLKSIVPPPKEMHQRGRASRELIVRGPPVSSSAGNGQARSGKVRYLGQAELLLSLWSSLLRFRVRFCSETWSHPAPRPSTGDRVP